jgi:predicted peptidase
LLLYLHGMSENGDGTTELRRVLRNGIAKLIALDDWPSKRPFIVLAPQHEGGAGGIPGGCPTGSEVHAFLSWAMSAYRIDPRRVYLTGLSCGSVGAWSYLADQGGSTVAAALLAGGDPGAPATSSSAWGRRGCGLADVAIWAVHGSHDVVVPIAGERATIERLAACPSPPAHVPVFTEVAPPRGGPIDGHDVWTALYGGSWQPDPYEWLLAHSRP